MLICGVLSYFVSKEVNIFRISLNIFTPRIDPNSSHPLYPLENLITQLYLILQLKKTMCSCKLSRKLQWPGVHGGGVSPGREMTATGIFLYLYYPGMRIRMLITSTWGLFLVFAIFVHVVWWRLLVFYGFSE